MNGSTKPRGPSPASDSAAFALSDQAPLHFRFASLQLCNFWISEDQIMASRIANNVAELIGNTPLVYLNNVH
ncbi:unnamed protein product [Microthlaspi erraticum]|uniref:Uncharacterized protein n=1 Tax=Microthlaspi erraticum TaxID=1685480 RepID=A0A6D2LCT9_9BRAS|nr:unnamed protein product [Microthlaspi erraticum]CAA7057535.1 unnamed protein product [Microthlaspi erraticum]